MEATSEPWWNSLGREIEVQNDDRPRLGNRGFFDKHIVNILRACLNCIAKNFYRYFEMDFLLHICRCSGLNQKWEVDCFVPRKDTLKRALKFSKDDFLSLYKKFR